MSSASGAFGRYELVRKIADGGMASIYLASTQGPGGFAKPCVIKRIRPEYSAAKSFREMLVREAKVAALLSHPNIVQVFDFGEVDGEYFLTMEYVDGLPLSRLITREWRAQRRLPVPVALSVALEIARALEYIAGGVTVDGQFTKIVHRDVSPSNVLVATSGAVKLTDFGIVKVLEASAATVAGVIKGKYAYMSPEQLGGRALDIRSDLFSLGVVLFESLTSKRLFRRPDVAATIAAVLGAQVPPVSSIVPEVPPEVDAIVARALAKDPDARYAHASDLIADLEAALAILPDHRHADRQRAEVVNRNVVGRSIDVDDTVSTTPSQLGDALLGDVPLVAEPLWPGTVVAAFESEEASAGGASWWVMAAVLLAAVLSLAFWLFVLD